MAEKAMQKSIRRSNVLWLLLAFTGFDAPKSEVFKRITKRPRLCDVYGPRVALRGSLIAVTF
jgi:hypothetical protein